MTPEDYQTFTGLKPLTKEEEYQRTAEVLPEILEKYKESGDGMFYLIAFLCDSQYCNKDLKEIMKYLHPRNKRG